MTGFAALPVARAGLVALALCAVSSRAFSESRWIYSLSVPSDLEYDSNPLMSSTQSQSVTRLRTMPQLHARYQGDRDELEINGGIALERSSDPQVSADRQDPRVRADWRHATPVGGYGMYMALEQEAYRSADVAVQVPRELDGTRRLVDFGANWTYTVDPNHTLSANAHQERVTFDAGQIADYWLSAATVQFSGVTSERTSWYTSAAAQSYRPAATPGLPSSHENSGSFGVLAGYRRALTESMDLDLGAGLVRFTGPLPDTGWQGTAKLTYKGPRLDAWMEASRRPDVDTASSRMSLTSIARVGVRYALDERSGLGLTASASRFHAFEDTSAKELTAVYDRQLTRFWSMAVRAQYRARTDQAGSATANLVSLTVKYLNPDF